ncbi:hypothetical protein BGY98DRAFT_1093409 [Russula aff. rugulosa BPL654]|nr:hypothetical protein BGY98DRAFT_1093409 [Russula aff. rugulosa BPL654]
MSGIALGAAYAAVQLVHQAYSKVKTSKARCARLVWRCQFVIDRLERIATTKGGDAIIRERIYELERAFEQTAMTIVQVGQQGVIASLLRAEANALRIEACNEALTELISLFNVRPKPPGSKFLGLKLVVCHSPPPARRNCRPLSMGHRIESGNAAINRELAQQGDAIAQVLRGIHDINAGLQNVHLNRETLKIAIPLTTIADALGPQPTLTSRRTPDRNLNIMGSRSWLPTPTPTSTTTSAPLPKAKVTGSGTLASGPSTLYIPCAYPRTAEKPRSSTLRRLTFTRKCVKMVPLTKALSSKRPSSSFPPSSHSPSRGAAAAHPAMASSSASYCDHPLPAEPPPPYQLRVVNPAPASSEYDYDHIHDRRGTAAAAKSSSSRFTAASIEAIRAPDSPSLLFLLQSYRPSPFLDLLGVC